MVMVEKTDMTAEMDQADKTVQVERLKTLPAADGFHMPGEFEPHKGTIMIWPERPGSWAYGAKDARKAFAKIAEAIAEGEEVYMLAGPSSLESAKAAFSGKSEKIHILPIETDDAWARDVGPTFVKNARKEVRGINWRFNAWGGEVDGLYASWEKDDAAAEAICDALDYPVYDVGDFVLEGGSIHSDGEGTLLVTEACLLSPGRNPHLTKEEIDEAYEKNTGVLIADRFDEDDLDYVATPAVLCKNHGPFTWGKDAHEAVHNAVVLEEVAKMASRCEMINPDVKPAPQELQDKHYFRKHGANAYYGQPGK